MTVTVTHPDRRIDYVVDVNANLDEAVCQRYVVWHGDWGDDVIPQDGAAVGEYVLEKLRPEIEEAVEAAKEKELGMVA